jgi:hypothetical protein
VFSWREPEVLKCTFTKTQGSISIHDIHLHMASGWQLFADTMKFWLLFSSFVRQGKKKRTSRSYLCGEFRFSESPVQIQNWTIIYHGTEHFVSHHFSSLETTHYAFSSSAFAQLQRLTFFTRWCVEPSPKHIYTAEILNIPPRASKWKFEPCDRASILDYICVLRFVSGNLCQQLSVTTKRCNCFRGNRSWENAGLLLGSL